MSNLRKRSKSPKLSRRKHKRPLNTSAPKEKERDIREVLGKVFSTKALSLEEVEGIEKYVRESTNEKLKEAYHKKKYEVAARLNRPEEAIKVMPTPQMYFFEQPFHPSIKEYNKYSPKDFFTALKKERIRRAELLVLYGKMKKFERTNVRQSEEASGDKPWRGS